MDCRGARAAVRVIIRHVNLNLVTCWISPSVCVACPLASFGGSISPCIYIYKWKNHFSEMKGDVGMSHHEKEENKKMPIPRKEIIDNPIPTSLFMYYAAVLLCVGTGGAI